MSRYKKGLRSTFQKSSHVHVGSGPLIATPGYIKGEIGRLQSEMVAFDGDVIKSLSGSYRQWLSIQSDEMLQEIFSRCKPPAKDLEDLKTRWGVLGQFPDSPLYNFYQFYSTTWITVYRGWLTFYADHEGFRDWYWGNVIDSIESWRRQLVACREQVRQFENIVLEDGTDSGMVITSPDPQKGPDWGPSNWLKGAGGFLKTLVIGGAIVVGGIFGIKILQGGSRSIPSAALPPASASPSKKPRSKAEAQRERVLAAMERKEK